VPDHGELPNHFPKVICKELGMDEAYNITCDEFDSLENVKGLLELLSLALEINKL